VLRAHSAALLALALTFGCKASLEGDVNASTNANASANVTEPDTESETSHDLDKPLEATAKTPEADEESSALLGVRQDLTFKGPGNVSCKCLSVAVGAPGNAAFQWAGKPPRVSSDSQLVIGLGSAGVECPEAGEGTAGASYWGYEMSGNDVVVVVESAGSGRPVASGAVIPRPQGNGQVYVRPVDKATPYGRPTAGGAGRCQVSHLAALSPSPGAPAPSSGVRIHSDEPEPTSPKVEIP
jgi:hypothetical protein